jgi:hypothetical protein
VPQLRSQPRKPYDQLKNSSLYSHSNHITSHHKHTPKYWDIIILFSPPQSVSTFHHPSTSTTISSHFSTPLQYPYLFMYTHSLTSPSKVKQKPSSPISLLCIPILSFFLTVTLRTSFYPPRFPNSYSIPILRAKTITQTRPDLTKSFF